jgi:hypothetical protein
MKKYLGEILIVLLIVGALAAILIPAGCRAQRTRERQQAREVLPGPDSETFIYSPNIRYSLATWTHDGHQFVVAQTYTGLAIIHHPGCKCLLTPAPVERP